MVSEESKELKQLYIEEELSQHGEWLCDMLMEAIDKRRLVQTRGLKDSIKQTAFHQGENPGLKVSFFSYGRAFEIAGNKKNRHTVDTNREVWGMKQNRRAMKKNTQWYAKNMFGGLNRLISRVMYGLSDREIERLKGILENRKMNGNG